MHHRFALASAAIVALACASASSASADVTFVKAWGSQGKGPGQFNSPTGLATDANGNVYVADTQNYRIQEFDSDGNYLRSWGKAGREPGDFGAPRGVAVAKTGDVYVADTGNDRIEEFDASGHFVRAWGSQGKGQGQLWGPWGITVGLTGDVYVTEYWNQRIQEFDAVGNPVRMWGSVGSDPGQFFFPAGIAAGRYYHFYVADRANQRIQVFTDYGLFLHSWGGAGAAPGQFEHPGAVAVGDGGSAGDIVYVADTDNNRIQSFDDLGHPIETWGKSGKDPGKFNSPEGVAVGPGGAVYVADTGNNRIEKFRVGPPSRRRAVEVRDSTKRYKVRPNGLRFELPNAGIGLKGLKPWRRWGEPQTSAIGSERYRACAPGCTGGHVRHARVRVRLSHIGTCHGRAVYERLRVVPRRRGVAVGHGRISCRGVVKPAR